MRYVLVASVLLLTLCASAFSEDYLRINVDTLYEGQTSDWEFYIKRECPEPEFIYGITNGWMMNAIGNATWEFWSGWTPFAEHLQMWNLGGLLPMLDDIKGTGMTEGGFLVGGAAMTPGGMPVIVDEMFFFSLTITMGDLPPGSSGDGIEIDSLWPVISGDSWHWSWMTCGPSEPDHPLFLDKYGGDEQHPIFLPVLALPCTSPAITVAPVNNQLSGDHCVSLTFEFEADPGQHGEDAAAIEDWSVIAGIGSIDNSGVYFTAPRDPGTYPVTIEATNSCGSYATYSFDVEFTNSEPTVSGCQYNCGLHARFFTPAGETFSYPLIPVDNDPCDNVSLSITGVEVIVGDAFEGGLHLDGDVLVITPSLNDDGVALCVEVTADDSYDVTVCEIGYEVGPVVCGNVDHLERVDIDDLVFIIGFIFLGGSAPEPYELGDVNCSGEVDIDDVVYMIAYIFTGGNAPCDLDGDGTPDC